MSNTQYFILGEYFGYPKCCISEFVREVNTIFFDNGRLNRKLSGTGFIPCKKCNETKMEADLIQEINRNRHCPTEFISNINNIQINKESFNKYLN